MFRLGNQVGFGTYGLRIGGSFLAGKQTDFDRQELAQGRVGQKQETIGTDEMKLSETRGRVEMRSQAGEWTRVEWDWADVLMGQVSEIGLPWLQGLEGWEDRFGGF